ncbi:MAG: hypothetical protein V3T55_02120 [Anaerolineales bacterium]
MLRTPKPGGYAALVSGLAAQQNWETLESHTGSGMDEVAELSDGKHRLPAMDVSKNPCFDPHIVLLAAGANLAACLDGDIGFRTMSNRR